MIINSLFLHNFRNLKNVEIKFNERLNIIIGDNGQGKTNIIEAIHFLTEGESFRFGKYENLISIGNNESLIKAFITNGNFDYKIICKLIENKKQILINDKSVSQNKLKQFSSVLFSPESLSVIKESSDQRRMLIDQLVEQVTNQGLAIIKEYKKVLRTRNRLLKDIAEEKIEFKTGKDTLESLNYSFLKLAVELTVIRIEVLNTIRPEIEKSLNSINKRQEQTQNINFDYQYVISELDHKQSDKEKIEIFLKKRMSELEVAELKSGVSLVGPHKHDIVFLYNGNNSRFYCSQGQQRSIILAYKMAQIVYHYRVHGFYPFLLLDDVLSELDLSKQESLISTLNQTETQTFVTTTDVSLLSKLSMDKASVFKIRNGEIVV